jgi:MFS family permease
MGRLEDTAALPGQPTRARFVFLAYAATLSLVLYLDRICISKSAESIAWEFRLDKVDMGWVFTAFTLGYTLFEIPSGSWGDRYGAKRVLCRIVLWWSLFTVLTGCIWPFLLDSGYLLMLPGTDLVVPLALDGFALLMLVRFLFGVGEAGAYPNIAKSSGRWFPLRERGLAQGVVATAGRLGGGVAAGVTIAITALVNTALWPGMGWRVTFWLFGLLGIVWAVLFTRWFRNSPAEHPAVNAAELALITEGNPVTLSPAHPVTPSSRHPVIPWRVLLTRVNLWVYAAMAFCSAFVVYLYFTHFPAYLKERHHVPERWGWVAGLPMIAGAVGCTLGGLLTDWLVRRTGSRRWGRRLPGLLGKGGGALFLLAGAAVDDPVWAVLLISLSAFSSDLAVAAHWAVCTDVGGRFVATVFAIMNMMAGIGAILSPVAAGYLLEGFSPTGADNVFDAAAREKAWDVVLYLFAGMLAVSALCWLRIDAEESMVEEKTALPASGEREPPD